MAFGFGLARLAEVPGLRTFSGAVIVCCARRREDIGSGDTSGSCRSEAIAARIVPLAADHERRMRASPVEFAALFDGLDWTRFATCYQPVTRQSRCRIRAHRFLQMAMMPSLPARISRHCASAGDIRRNGDGGHRARWLQAQNDRSSAISVEADTDVSGVLQVRTGLVEEQLHRGLKPSSRRSPGYEAEAEKRIPSCALTYATGARTACIACPPAAIR